jgi:hypothetical protein
LFAEAFVGVLKRLTHGGRSAGGRTARRLQEAWPEDARGLFNLLVGQLGQVSGRFGGDPAGDRLCELVDVYHW